jgi:hypothetical protein
MAKAKEGYLLKRIKIKEDYIYGLNALCENFVEKSQKGKDSFKSESVYVKEKEDFIRNTQELDICRLELIELKEKLEGEEQLEGQKQKAKPKKSVKKTDVFKETKTQEKRLLKRIEVVKENIRYLSRQCNDFRKKYCGHARENDPVIKRAYERKVDKFNFWFDELIRYKEVLFSIENELIDLEKELRKSTKERKKLGREKMIEEIRYQTKKRKEKRLEEEIQQAEYHIACKHKWLQYFKEKYDALIKNNPELKLTKKINWRKEPSCREDIILWDKEQKEDFILWGNDFRCQKDFIEGVEDLEFDEKELIDLEKELRKLQDNETWNQKTYKQ